MATALQKQLRAIAIKASRSLDVKAQRQAFAQSLVFSREIAGRQDVHTLYELCKEGFEQLCLLDDKFKPYSSVFFSEQSKEEDRRQLTKEQSNELNIVIECFLRQVSSKLRLKAGQLAVEWLLRRFRVQEFNTAALLYAFLPYHNTDLLVRLLLILPQESLPGEFRFLRRYMEEGVNPPLSEFVRAASISREFFSGLNNWVFDIVKMNCPNRDELITFWTAVILQATHRMLDSALTGQLAAQAKNEDRALTMIITCLSRGFTLARNDNSVAIGCLMISVVVASKIELSKHVIIALMKTIATIRQVELEPHVLTSMAMLVRRCRDDNDELLSAKVLGYFSRLENPIDSLRKAKMLAPIDELVYTICITIVEQGFSGEEKFIKLLQDVTLEEDILSKDQIEELINRLLKKLVENNDVKNISRIVEMLQKLMASHNWICDLIFRLSTSLGLKEVMNLLENCESISQVETSSVDNIEAEENFEKQICELERPGSIDKISFLNGQYEVFFEQLRKLLFDRLGTRGIEYFRGTLNSSDGIFSSNGKLDDVCYLTFLLRCAIYAQEDVRGNIAAINLITEFVLERETLKYANLSTVYMLLALNNKNKAVREAAIRFFRKLSEWIDDEREVCQSNGGGDEVSVWFNQVYRTNSSDAIHLLLNKNELAAWLQMIIIPRIDECGMDPEYLEKSLNEQFNAYSVTALKKKARPHPSNLLFSYIASHAVQVEHRDFRIRLLALLRGNLRASRGSILNLVFTSFKRTVQDSSYNQDHELIRSYLETFSPRDSECMTLMHEIIETRHKLPEVVIDENLKLLCRIWPNLTTSLQDHFGKVIVKALVQPFSSPGEIQRFPFIRETIETIKLSDKLVVDLLMSLPEFEFPTRNRRIGDVPRLTKRARKTHDIRQCANEELGNAENVNSSISDSLCQLDIYTVALHLLDSIHPLNNPDLIDGIFYVLRQLLRSASYLGSSPIYLELIAMNCLAEILEFCCNQNSSFVVRNRDHLRLDVLLEYVTSTTNSQLFTKSCTIISLLAQADPEFALHSAFSTVPLINVHLIQKLDEFSLQSVDKILTNLLYAVKSSPNTSAPHLQFMANSSFLINHLVAAFPRISSSHRTSIYAKLFSILPVDHSFHILMLIFADKLPNDHNALALLIDLFSSLDPNAQFVVLSKYLSISLSHLTLQSPLLPIIIGQDSSLISLPSSSTQTLSTIIPTSLVSKLLSFLAKFLRQKSVRSLVRRHLYPPPSPPCHLQALSGLLGDSLHLCYLCQSSSASLDLLTGLFSLPSPSTCLDLINFVHKSLISSWNAQSESSCDSQVSILFDHFLQFLQFHSTSSSLSFSSSSLIKFLSQVISHKSFDLYPQSSANSIISLTIYIASHHAQSNTDTLLKTCKLLIRYPNSSIPHQTLKFLSIFSRLLSQKFLPFLPTAFEKSCQIVGQSDHPIPSLYSSLFSFYTSIILNLPNLLTPDYLNTILHFYHQSYVQFSHQTSFKHREKLSQAFTTNLDPQTVILALHRNFTQFLQNPPVPFLALTNLLHSTINAHPSPTICQIAPQIFDLLLELFDFRSALSSSNLDPTTLETCESSLLDTFLALAVKLNDKLFRPFFARFVKWTSATSVLPLSARQSVCVQRSITLFNATTAVFTKFKSLLTSYSLYYLDLITPLLSIQPPNIPLVTAVLSTLRASFQYDKSNFWQDSAHFDQCLHPLLSLLALPTSQPFLDSLIDTIVQFASATPSPDQLKRLNSPIISLLRNPSSQLRMTAIACQVKLTTQLAEQWLVLLPELLPIISELQEDMDPLVEESTLNWIKLIESVSGENLDPMLR